MSGLVLLCADDEAPALDDLTRMLRASERVAEVEGVDGAPAALAALGRRAFDGLFLDVRMPGMDGVELARAIGRSPAPPAVVFVTAYETAAVEAFELGAVDYLVKPVSRVRLDEALARVAAARRPEGDLVSVPTPRGGTRLLPRSSVLYVQAYGDYVRIHSDEGRFLLREALADVEERWAPHGFARVHRGYVANLRRATELRPNENGTAVLVMEDGFEVPIARRQVPELRRRIRT